MASAAVHSKGGGSVVVDSLFIFAPIACGFFVFGPCSSVLSSFSTFSLRKTGRECWLLYFI